MLSNDVCAHKLSLWYTNQSAHVAELVSSSRRALRASFIRPYIGAINLNMPRHAKMGIRNPVISSECSKLVFPPALQSSRSGDAQ